MKVEACRRGQIGWSMTLVTRRYRYTLWLDRPHLTKLSRAPLSAHIDGDDGHAHPPVPPDDSFCEHGIYYEMPCSRCALIDGSDG